MRALSKSVMAFFVLSFVGIPGINNNNNNNNNKSNYSAPLATIASTFSVSISRA